MGMDFNVNVNVKTNGAEKIDALEAKIKSLKTQPINLKVNVDSKSLNVTNLGSQLQSSFASAGTSAGKAYNTALQTQINAMAKTQQTAFTAPLKNMSKYEKSYSDMWNKLMSKAPSNYGKSKQQIAFDEYFAKVEQVSNKANEIQKRVSQKFLDVESSGVKKVLTKYSGTNSSEYKSLEASYSKLMSLQKELKTGISNDVFKKTLSDGDIVSKYQQFYEVLSRSKNEMKILSNETTSLSKPFSQLDAATASNKTLTWLKNNSKAAKDYGAVLTDLSNKQRYATSGEELKKYTKQVQAIQAQAAALGKTGRSFTDELSRGFKKIGQFALTYGIIQRLAYQVPRAISQAVISIDDSVTQLKKVSDATDLQISSYFDEAAASAKKYGQTISDVIATTADWSRLGYSLEDSKLLSDITTLYQNVGDNMTQESASSSMISTLQGFQMQADEAMHIVDTYNEVGNRFAIGSDGIGEALQRSASSMYAANNSFEQTVGLVTAANTVVQDPDSVGIYVPTLKIAITVKLLGRTRPWKDHSIYNNFLKVNQGDLKIA